MFTNQRLWDLVDFSQVSYNDGSNKPLPSGYEHYRALPDPRTGAYADVCVNMSTGEVVVAIRGTEPQSFKDWNTNLGLGRGQYDALAPAVSPPFNL